MEGQGGPTTQVGAPQNQWERMGPRDDEIDLAEFVAVFRKIWWKVAILSLAVGVVTLLVLLRRPNLYTATTTVTPTTEEQQQSPALGALSSIGITLGTPTKVEDLETLFRNKSLTVRVFREYDLWPVIDPDGYDPSTGKRKLSWTERLFGGEAEAREPSDWDAVRAAEGRLGVSVNKRAGTVSVSFESQSPEGSARIVKHYLEEAKSRLQEETLERARRNKKFLVEQIQRTVDPITRDRLYSLYGKEVEQEMLALNRDQFGFKVIDPVMVPDRKSRPRRAKAALLATVLAFPVWTILLGLRARKRAESPSDL